MNSEDSKRSAINLNLPLVKGKLAMRVAAVSEEAVTHVKPNLDRQDRYYGVVTAQPFANTTISLHGEKVNRFSNRAPRVMPVDAVSLWENASRVTGSGYTSDRPLFDNRVTGAVNPGGFTVGNLANSPVFARQGLPAVMLFGAGALTGNFQSWNNSVEAREPQNIPTATPPAAERRFRCHSDGWNRASPAAAIPRSWRPTIASPNRRRRWRRRN
jgi:hypothetical protein